jgi:hypothetical protein
MAVWDSCLFCHADYAIHWFKDPKVTLNLAELTSAQEQVVVDDEGLVIDAVDVPPPTAKEKDGTDYTR